MGLLIRKLFKLLDWGFDLDGDSGGLIISTQFKETASAVYDFSTSDYSTVSSGKATNLAKCKNCISTTSNNINR